MRIILGKPADVYLIDEPSAYLDCEQRIVASKVIKRYESCPLVSSALSFFTRFECTFILHSFRVHFHSSLVSSVLFRFILHSKKTAFIVEHDFIMATYLADRVIVYEGILH